MNFVTFHRKGRRGDERQHAAQDGGADELLHGDASLSFA